MALCLYTLLHLNVPAPGETWTKITWRKVKYLVVSFVWPELPAAMAAGQWAAARRSLKMMRDLYGGDQWTMLHAYYAEMGGFMVQMPDTKAFSITSRHLHFLVSKGYTTLPMIKKEEIEDKSKADAFLKVIALSQAGWLILQVIARAVQGLHISLLEISACDMIACWTPTIFFWFRKPLDITVPEVIHIDTPMAIILCDAGDAAKTPFRQTPLDFVESLGQISELFIAPMPKCVSSKIRLSPGKKPLERIPNDLDPLYHSVLIHWYVALPFYLLAGLNFAAWHAIFPTDIEKTLWRCSVIVYLVCMMIWGHFELALQALEGSTKPVVARMNSYKLRFPAALLFWVPVLIAFTARMCIMGETFASLRAMPADVYQDIEWTNFIPHVS